MFSATCTYFVQNSNPEILFIKLEKGECHDAFNMKFLYSPTVGYRKNVLIQIDFNSDKITNQLTKFGQTCDQ